MEEREKEKEREKDKEREKNQTVGDNTNHKSGFYQDTLYLLYAYKSFFPSGGINDLHSTYASLEEAFIRLMSLKEHPYNIQLVERDTLICVSSFSEAYKDYLSIINNSKFELLINKFQSMREEIDEILDKLRDIDENRDESENTKEDRKDSTCIEFEPGRPNLNEDGYSGRKDD